MADKTQWSVDNTCKLIEFYRKTPLLWDASHSDYKNRCKKTDSLKEIAKYFNVSDLEVERKIRNINSQYRREKRNHKALRKSGAGRTFQSKWFGYPLMSFLKDNNKPGKCTDYEKCQDAGGLSIDRMTCEDSCNTEEDEEKPRVNTDNDVDIDEITNKEVDVPVLPITEFVSVTSPNKKLKTATENKKIAQSVTEERRKEVYSMLKSVHNRQERQQASPDDYDVFGDIVARKLRNLPTRYAQITLQHLINNLLYEGELGKYNQPPAPQRS